MLARFIHRDAWKLRRCLYPAASRNVTVRSLKTAPWGKEKRKREREEEKKSTTGEEQEGKQRSSKRERDRS